MNASIDNPLAKISEMPWTVGRDANNAYRNANFVIIATDGTNGFVHVVATGLIVGIAACIVDDHEQAMKAIKADDSQVSVTAMSKPQIDAALAITDNRRSYRERRTFDSTARRAEAGLTENRKADRRIE